MKTALVTGGAGFIGSHLCGRLLERGYRVIALDNLYTGSLANIAAYEDTGRFFFIEGDVAELEPCAESLPRHLSFGDRTQIDEIYNLACPASPVHYQATPLKTLVTSIKGAMLCLELARELGAKLLHASTSEVYGDPLVHPQEEHQWGNVNPIGIRSCYDEGKRVDETLIADYIRTYDVDARMVRIFNTYGPRMHPHDGRVVSNFIVQALADEDITIYGDGSQTRSFQYVEDLLNAFEAYMALDKARVREFFKAKGLGAPVLNTGNPGEYTIRELAEKTLEKLPQSKSKIVWRELPGDDPKKRRPDISLAKELLGWEPRIPLDVGLERTIEYFRNLPEQQRNQTP
ncbi:MAG: SDR family oxidoreductase [Kiritimatiellae bacterium]|nr:SDR family oxidoreductase [Kiritimatiellia bacterium]